MAFRTLEVELRANVGQFKAGMGAAAGSVQDFHRQMSGAGTATTQNIEQVGRTALVMAGAVGGALAVSTKAAIDWESSWAGVTKTVDGTKSQLAGLEGGLRDMAKSLPASHGEIASVAEAAGQLGIKVGDVEGFTKVMIDLGETTNLTAEQAATSLARFANIMGTSSKDFERLGSTIVELGNNSETTEAEIVELGTRLAAAGKIAGLSESDVLAFAATLTSVGVEAEAGGTALSKVFTSVRDAVIDGSDSLEVFAEVAGVSADDFARSFGEDPAEAISSFISGLGRMNRAGESTTAVFEDLELTDQRLMRALLSTAEAQGHLDERLEMGAAAWKDNVALAEEAEKRYGTTAAQMEMLRNKVTDLGIDVGEVLLPALRTGAEVLGSLADAAGELPGPVKTIGVVTATSATALLGMVGILGTFGPKVIG